MTEPKMPDPAMLVMGLLHRQDVNLRPLLERLQRDFGLLLNVSDPIAFDFSEYYEEEMGPNLQRRLMAFQTLIDPSRLAKIKRVTNVIEDDLRDEQKRRRVNLDPGYLNGAHLILASCKGFSHRPYLGMGVHADLTLLWQHGKFDKLPWTYPDYGSEALQSILCEYRTKYMDLLRTWKKLKDKE